MEGFLSFLVIVGIVLKFVNKSKKTGNAENKGTKGRKKASPPAQPAAAQPAASPSVPAPDITWLLDEENCPEEPHAHAEGASHADDKGCIGGSMAHETHEGRNVFASHGSMFAARAEGPGNLAAKTAPEPEKRPAPQAHKPRLNAAEMRQAIVTSEILREPVALRGRTARR